MESDNRLLASSGKEFIKPTGILKDAAEVRKARKAAMGRLGLDFLDNVGDGDEMDIEKELAADDDVDVDAELKTDGIVKPEPRNAIKIDSPVETTHPFHDEATPDRNGSTTPAAEDDLSGLSARERNRLKRKRKGGGAAFVAPPPQPNSSKFNAASANAAGTKYVHTPLSVFAYN
jgi:TATA-binding protein-associated factor